MSGTWEQPHAPRGSGLLMHPGPALGSLVPSSFLCRGMECRWPCGGHLAPVEGHTGRCGAWSSAQAFLCLQVWWSLSTSSPMAGSWTFCVGAPSASSPTSRTPPPKSSSPLPSELRVHRHAVLCCASFEALGADLHPDVQNPHLGLGERACSVSAGPHVSSGITTFLPSCWRPCVGDCTHWLRAASLLRVGLSTETAATHAACSAILQAVSALTREPRRVGFRLTCARLVGTGGLRVCAVSCWVMQPPHGHGGLRLVFSAVVIVVYSQLLGTQAGAHVLVHEYTCTCELACACMLCDLLVDSVAPQCFASDMTVGMRGAWCPPSAGSGRAGCLLAPARCGPLWCPGCTSSPAGRSEARLSVWYLAPQSPGPVVAGCAGVKT